MSPDSTEPENPTLAYPDESLAVGQTLGNRFRIRAQLGRGGMGEVWRAVDLKLRVDIALKALRPELLADERALELLRQEVRMAREVISPNVCRVFDLVEIEDRELISMEYIDGVNLLDILKMRAPLPLSEAREIAAQFLAGLEAIHEAGLVHRDVKPENLMMTRSGRVVLMDFGIAKGLADGRARTVTGTPAYMAPEQTRGEAQDARIDVFSAGVVLAEMVAPDGVGTFEARQAIWEGIRADPPRLPDSPWAPVLTKAAAQQRENRYPGVAALARALEEVTLRADRAEDVRPYPGLSSFSTDDAEYFFGRELEVEEMWKKLRRPQLYGLIGPSGAGKSSFLRAGLLSVTPTGWSTIQTTPGSQPFANLARALAPQVSGDSEALQRLFDTDDNDSLLRAVAAWRAEHDEVLVVLDQFEELFTQNPADVQSRYAELLGRFAIETDVHILVSMRDDFLFYCSSQPALSPMFSELTPLRPPSGNSLRRALVQPALKCGYRFEDDTLVDAMIEEVAQERGALPLLAFAAARLWDRRDRERGFLTRDAYEHIGGVAGALAQHAEQTLDRIGHDHIPVVRELFRNLMTAQATRAARDRDELLSVFGGSGVPATEPARSVRPRVFLSYSRADTDRARQLAERLEARGFSVWWDRHITPGKNFDEVIETALAEARAVVVLWSATSVDSNWVKAEASEALEKGRLVPALIDRVKPPLEFRRLEAAELYDLGGEAARQELSQLEEALRTLVDRRKPKPVAKRTRPDQDKSGGPERENAERILDSLIDARLLTSYEASVGDDQGATQQIEIIHESLLSKWPRLVRWQTQDQDGALLRDQLRQAARMWEARGQPEDLLWTGTSYNEYQLWRERYGGGLSSAEEAYAAAMESRAQRRARRRRATVAGAFVVLLTVLAVVFASRQEARRQASRAEANQLLSLGRQEIDQVPTLALAYGLASLERADSEVTRLFILDALWRGPPALRLDSDYIGFTLDFSPDGRWLAAAGADRIELWSSTGGPPKTVELPEKGKIRQVRFGRDSDAVVALQYQRQTAYLLSASSGEIVRTFELPTEQFPEIRLPEGLDRLFTFTQEGPLTKVTGTPLDGGSPRTYGEFDGGLRFYSDKNPRWVLEVGPRGEHLAFVPSLLSDPPDILARRIFMAPLSDLASAPPRLVGTHPEVLLSLAFDPTGRYLASGEMAGGIRVWDLAGSGSEPAHSFYSPGGAYGLDFDSRGSRLAATSGDGRSYLWDLEGPPDAGPLWLREDGLLDGDFHPNGTWFAAGSTLWPLERPYPIDLEGHEARIFGLEFLPDGSGLVSTSADGTLRLWPLYRAAGDSARTLLDTGGPYVMGLSIDASSRWILASDPGATWLIAVDGSERRKLEGLGGANTAVALDHRGELAAIVPREAPELLRVLDLRSGDVETLPLEEGWTASRIRFTPDGRLVGRLDAGEEGEIVVWNLEEGSHEVLSDRGGPFDLTPDGRFLITGSQGDVSSPTVHDLIEGTSFVLESHGLPGEVALDPTGRVAISRRSDGHAQVGPVTGDEPHLLVGPRHFGRFVVSPDGRWLAATHGTTIRLWPMPDISETPLHTLPQDELLARLRHLTNVRIVRDPESETGWDWSLDPFPGWEVVPWW